MSDITVHECKQALMEEIDDFLPREEVFITIKWNSVKDQVACRLVGLLPTEETLRDITTKAEEMLVEEIINNLEEEPPILN
jgi:hypothetical protein